MLTVTCKNAYKNYCITLDCIKQVSDCMMILKSQTAKMNNNVELLAC